MRKYIIRRILLALVTMVGVTIIVFLLMRLVPGDPASAMLGEDATKQDHIRMRKILGLDRPVYQQYFVWISHIVRGEFGASYATHKPVIQEIKKRLPVSVELGILAILLGIVTALPIGALSALRQNTFLDFAGRLYAISGISVPLFWTGTMVLLIGSLYLHWVPPITYSAPWENPWANLELLGIAAAVMAFRLAGANARMMRSSMLEALRQDYVRTAWAKGLRERVVIMRHVLKNAMIPVVTLLGGEVIFLIGGTVIAETIFSIPGMGRYLIEGINGRDYPVVQGVVLLVATGVVFMNLLVDLSYGWFDPRVRYEA